MLISHLRMRFWMFRIVNPSRRVDEISVKNRAIWRGWGRVSLETWIANHFHQLETFESPKFYYPVKKDMDIPFIRYPFSKHIWFFFSQGRICYMFVPMTRMVSLYTSLASSQPLRDPGAIVGKAFALVLPGIIAGYNQYGLLTVKMDQNESISVMLRSIYKPNSANM